MEGNDLQSVEVYDNVSRRLLLLDNIKGDKVTFDMSDNSSGPYYIRVRTTHSTVIQRLIKK